RPEDSAQFAPAIANKSAVVSHESFYWEATCSHHVFAGARADALHRFGCSLFSGGNRARRFSADQVRSRFLSGGLSILGRRAPYSGPRCKRNSCQYGLLAAASKP